MVYGKLAKGPERHKPHLSNRDKTADVPASKFDEDGTEIMNSTDFENLAEKSENGEKIQEIADEMRHEEGMNVAAAEAEVDAQASIAQVESIKAELPGATAEQAQQIAKFEGDVADASAAVYEAKRSQGFFAKLMGGSKELKSAQGKLENAEDQLSMLTNKLTLEAAQANDPKVDTSKGDPNAFKKQTAGQKAKERRDIRNAATDKSMRNAGRGGM